MRLVNFSPGKVNNWVVQFTERAHLLEFCLGTALANTAQLVVDPAEVRMIWDLESQTLSIRGKGVWNVFLRLDVDYSSYEKIAKEQIQEDAKQRELKAARVESLAVLEQEHAQVESERQTRIHKSMEADGLRREAPVERQRVRLGLRPRLDLVYS